MCEPGTRMHSNIGVHITVNTKLRYLTWLDDIFLLKEENIADLVNKL